VLPSFVTALRISWVVGEVVGAGGGGTTVVVGGLVVRDGEVWEWGCRWPRGEVRVEGVGCVGPH
jgi:hypothetical protein